MLKIQISSHNTVNLIKDLDKAVKIVLVVATFSTNDLYENTAH